MSFDKAEILARLQDGDTMEEILDELSDVINEADADYKRIQEEEQRAAVEIEKAAKEAERVMNSKRAAVDGMLDYLCDYLVAAGEDDLIAELRDLDADKVIKMLDSSIAMAKSFEKLKEVEFNMPFADFTKFFM